MKSRIIVVGAKNTSAAPSMPPAGIAAALWEAAGNAGRAAAARRPGGFSSSPLWSQTLGVKGSSSHFFFDLPNLKRRIRVSLL